MNAATTHHKAQLPAPEETTGAAKAKDSMIRGDQRIVLDAVSGCSSRCFVLKDPGHWTDILLVAVVDARRAAEIAASATVLITPPNSP